MGKYAERRKGQQVGNDSDLCQESANPLSALLEHEDVSISNNQSESAIRSFAVGRNYILNPFLFSAVMFSLLQATMENGRYPTCLMKTAKDEDMSQEDAIQSLLP